MAAITVQVDKEEKEISGLTRKTTCRDVLLALLTDKKADLQLLLDQGQDLTQDDFEILNSTKVKELAKEFVIIENWRGCEKVLSRRTRILMVWQAWGNEQKHVTFSLKKDKDNRFYASRHSHKDSSRHRCDGFLDKDGTDSNDPSRYKLSQGRKRQIRRSMLRFQQAVINQHSQDEIDGNNNGEKALNNSREQNPALPADQVLLSGQKARSDPIGILSEEQLVDQNVNGPDCLLEDNLKNKFLRSAADKGFNRERCTYRRPHHRRRSLLLEESDGFTDRNVVLTSSQKHEFHHYPYCHKSRRRSNSKRRHRHYKRRQRDNVSKRSHNAKQAGERCSTDSTASTGSISLPSDNEVIAYSEGEDADDEKSVMAEFNCSISGQNLSQFPGSLLTYDERCCSGTGSASTATTTDSSSGNTTCSETSNTSGSSFTTSSSETSSGADVESYFAKRDAAAAAAAAAKANTSEKSKGGASKLLKPAHTLISSFKKKKKPSQNAQLAKPNPLLTSVNKLNSKSNDSSTKSNLSPFITQSTQSFKNPEVSISPSHKSNKDLIKSSSSPCRVSNDEASQLNEKERKEIEEITKLILSQEQNLKTQNNKIQTACCDIQKSEFQVRKWNVGMEKSSNYKSLSGNDKTKTSSLRTRWIQECTDASLLERYIDSCDRVVSEQLKIEENKRNSEILIQKIREQVWSGPDGSQLSKPNSLSAAALGIIADGEDDNSSDEESDSLTDTLSVSAGTLKSNKKEETGAGDQQEEPLLVERTRMEMEANLYLGLRLSTELEEVEKLLLNSQQLLQNKGETLLKLVRDLSQTSDGISPKLWTEYGELLTAYDAEMQLQQYLAACAKNDIAKHLHNGEADSFKEQHLARIVNGLESNSASSSAVNHALSPWLWCEHCKEELERSKNQGKSLSSGFSAPSPHWLTHTTVPSNFSALPLPNPPPSLQKQQHAPSSPRLLQMPPVDLQGNESDNDDFRKKPSNSKALATSTIISTEEAIPKGLVFHLPRQHAKQPIPRSSPMSELISSSFRNSANTDDSGNASAESTASFASDCTDLGSRNSSCDGGSPRPQSVTAESVDSAHSSPFFARGNFKKNSSKSKFTFPSNFRLNKSELVRKNATELMKSSTGVEFPLEQNKHAENTVEDHQTKKLVRRNSGKNKKSAPVLTDAFMRRATSFGKGSVKGPVYPNRLNGILKKPIMNNSHFDLSRKNVYGTKKQYQSSNVKSDHVMFPNSSHSSTPLYSHSHFSLSYNRMHAQNPQSHSPLINAAKINNSGFDNDSDTGLSSLHSTESYDRLCPATGESLV